MDLGGKLHDKIATLCLDHFKTLPKSGKPKPNEWTVLSCIVVEFKQAFQVVALGTGSKCIGKSKMSANGDILNDSHAEVICRRSFLRSLYNAMKNVKSNSFLEFNTDSKKYSVQNGVRLHFFTTHVPCGDATIFPKDNCEDFGEILLESKAEDYEVPMKIIKTETTGDIFRTGAKCLSGDKKQDLKLAGNGYHVLGVVRTKPGRGDPTLSVSCSDKIAKWCHMGIQGALLSLLFDKPLYFTSLTIIGNTPFSKDALERALYDRLHIVDLKPPYHRQKLIVGQSTLKFNWEKESSKQPSDCSISWCDVKNKSLEVAVDGKKQGVTKKQLGTVSARLKICKLELFKQFIEVCELHDIKVKENCDIKTLNYREVKCLALDYNNNWKILRQSFKVWSNKDDQLLHFYIK